MGGLAQVKDEHQALDEATWQHLMCCGTARDLDSKSLEFSVVGAFDLAPKSSMQGL